MLAIQLQFKGLIGMKKALVTVAKAKWEGYIYMNNTMLVIIHKETWLSPALPLSRSLSSILWQALSMKFKSFIGMESKQVVHPNEKTSALLKVKNQRLTTPD